MSVFKKQALVESFPAYEVYEREADHHGLVNITAEDILGLKCAGFYRTYSPGSVVSYALQYNECPIAAVEECRAKMKSDPYAGHKLHWINARGSVLTSHKREAEKIVKVTIGMRVRFEGQVFEIKATHNNNLMFVAAEEVAA